MLFEAHKMLKCIAYGIHVIYIYKKDEIFF